MQCLFPYICIECNGLQNLKTLGHHINPLSLHVAPPFQKRSARRRQQNNTMQRKLHNSVWRKQCNTLTALQPCVPISYIYTHVYRAIRNGTTYCATQQSRVGLTHPGSPTLGRCMCGRTVGPFKRPPTLPLHTLPSHHTPPPPLYSSDTTLSASYQICSDCSTSFSIHRRKIKIKTQWVKSHGLNMKK